MHKNRNNLISELTKMYERDTDRKIFKHFIEYIRFPFFKNFEKNLKVSFNFPITFFVGQNGSGKSSLLHALYGAPDGKSVEEYWYTTDLDPILSLKDNRHCFIYSFKTEYSKNNAEVIKTRIQNKNKITGKINPDYWEPSRPLKKYEMEFSPENQDPREATKTRWKLISKNVYLLDFRYTLSAYDKYFYFGSKPNSKTLNSKQDVIRKYASKLKYAFNFNKKHSYYSRSATAPKILTEEERIIIGNILGKNYTETKIVEHDFYDRNKGFAVKYKTSNISYSEAYAGSGETAIVKLVYDLVNAEDYSLILLDEPETSLHPLAQKKLIDFILKQIIEKKLQVIVSTHSPDIIEAMPKESINIFYEDPDNKKIKVIQKVFPENAFIHIGRSLSLKKTIVVEDILAKILIERVLKELDDEELFDVKYFPGGANQTKKEDMIVYSKEKSSKHFIIFDGDQKLNEYDTSTFSDLDKNVNDLKEKIKNIVGLDIKFSIDRNRKDQQIELMLNYIKYHFENVFYLPKKTPEEILWDNEIVEKSEIEDTEIRLIKNQTDYKSKFSIYAKSEYGENKAEDIHSIHKKFITKWIKNKNEDYTKIVAIINKIKEK